MRKKILLAYLGLSQKNFVAEESVSMISEAISSCKPVYTLRHEIINSDENYQRILDKFENNKKIKRVKFSNKINLDFTFDFELNKKIKNYKGKI